ncbi:MAG: DUF3148 domain-containing protein [Synechocystis sp.]|nr:DUF3148 domain-containing protein [Synechocystis sp.]
MTDLPLTIGSKVRLTARPPYLKTADPMPMLRPPDLVAIAEEGQIVDCRPAGYWGVKFQRGTFLLEAQYLEILPADTAPTPE